MLGTLIGLDLVICLDLISGRDLVLGLLHICLVLLLAVPSASVLAILLARGLGIVCAHFYSSSLLLSWLGSRVCSYPYCCSWSCYLSLSCSLSGLCTWSSSWYRPRCCSWCVRALVSVPDLALVVLGIELVLGLVLGRVLILVLGLVFSLGFGLALGLALLFVPRLSFL